MDWKYILSLTPEDLTEQNIEDLYSTLAWYDFESEVFDSDKYIAVLKLSQEIMKFKAEQVQMLLTELDEVAIKQGEEEIKKLGSEADARSSKSRLKSPISADYSDLDQKYVDLKSKYKQQSKLLEKFKRNTKELKIKLTEVEQEKDQLQLELQRAFQEGSQSDISESVREQQKELIETLHHKNKQISSLLKDLEESESEKTLLKEKLVQVKDELADATQQLLKLNNETAAYKRNLEESSAVLEEIKLENVALKSQINDLAEEKESYDRQIEEFTEEVNMRVDEWKRILDEKDKQIKQLQAEIKPTLPSSTSTEEGPRISHTKNLNRILNERDAQIEMLQKQLIDATKEMEETTDTIKRIVLEKDTYERRVTQFNELNTDLKKQLSNVNEKCRQLQDDVAFLEKSYQTKSKDLQELISGLKGDESKLNLYKSISQIENLKAECLSKEKKIMSLVRVSNKLQEEFDHVCLENQAMRDKLGLQESDSVNITGVLIKYKKQKKALQHTQLKLSKLEDENVALKLNVQDLNRKNSYLSKQILKHGGKPDAENARVIEKDVEKPDENNVDLKALSEENEALRKGLHEILEGLQQKKKEPIQLTTLEKLLRALDVKHVSGWYHPAMRLQAELHSLQGINSELREQLKQKEFELVRYKESTASFFKTGTDRTVVSSPKTILDTLPERVSKSEHGIVSVLNQHLLNVLKIHKEVETENSLLKEKVRTYKTDFTELQAEIKNINENAKEQLKLLKEKVQNLEDRNNSVEEAAAIAESKLQEYITQSNLTNDETARAKRAVELAANLAVLNRKCLFFEKQESDLRKEINCLKENILITENDLRRKSCDLSAMEIALKSKLAVAENELKSKVDGESFQETQKDFDELNLKYKNLLRDYEHLCSENSLEVKILKETSNSLREEKHELQMKLETVLMKLHDESLEKMEDTLAKKLAETEVNEITERQRANHIQNLYELVKDQLQKSEDRSREFENNNKEIMHKNLLLHESLKDVQNKIANFVDVSTFKEVQIKYTAALKENEALLAEIEKFKGDVKVLNSTLETYKHWSASQEYEFLCLKHQIVDLQAATDDKTVIARLSKDVVNARLAESTMEQKVNNLTQELKECKRKCGENEKLLEEEKQRVIELRNEFDRRIGNNDPGLKNTFVYLFKVQDLSKNVIVLEKSRRNTKTLRETIRMQKQQYFGCVPLSIQEKFTEKLKQAALDKKSAFKSLSNARKTENDCSILREQLQKESQLLEELKNTLNKDKSERHLLLWQKESKSLELEILKLKRSAEFKENEIGRLQDRLNKQDEDINKLEEELLKLYQDGREILTQTVMIPLTSEIVQKPPEIGPKLKLLISKQTQTLDIIHTESKEDGYIQDTINKLQLHVLEKEKEISEKNNHIDHLRSKITELEMNVSLFRQQIGDRQSQIMFYENHILELRGKIEKAEKIPTDIANEVTAQRNEEALTLKATVSNLQAMLKDKDETILNYQTLLKKDRDEHSLAAARMQDELRRLQHALSEQQKANIKIQEASKTEQHPSRAAIEQYILQVHQLESHTAELHTAVASLTSQLQASREECVRWRNLANDRLETMEQLRKDLEEQHENEITSYKKDSEKWQQEVVELKQLMCKFKMETSQVVPDLNKVLKEKEDRIHELTVLLRQAKGEVKRNTEKDKDSHLILKFNELLASKEQLQKEYQMLKGRYEQLLNKEKGARDEIRELKYQLIKRPTLSSARSDKSDKSIKEQLQKKITTLEKELEEMKDNLDKQVAFNETHKLKMNEDFEKWKKQKHWQQLAEKLKTKIKEKEDANEKLQDTCNGYRILIQRLEREKHSLEARLKTFRITNPHTIQAQVENLRSENIKLQAEVDVLNSKLEISQHHSGGLGAAMLQEKLEAQERKIAVLELAAKGTVEIRAEVERLQNTVANLQKKNLCLEAENMELKLDLEKSAGDVPYMKEQIQHLESYVEALKTENVSLKTSANSSSQIEGTDTASNSNKKVSELEKTVFVLKRVVEKLQAENKRLLGGNRLCTLGDRSSTADQLRRDFNRIKQQYGASIQKAARLEQELNQANSKIKSLESKETTANANTLSDELCEVKSQLAQKSALLDQVKFLLQKAAVREKLLREEVDDLKRQLRSSQPERDA